MTRQLRILMISHHRRFKAFARPHAMAQHLVQKGHAVSLIVIANNRRFGIVKSDWDGVEIIETPDLLWDRLRSGWDGWDMLNRLAYLWRSHDSYDLIHCFETRPATIYPALFYRNLHELPLITDWNDWWAKGGIINEFRPSWFRPLFGRVEAYYEEAFRARADGLTVISTALRQRALDLGIAPDRICHISGGALPDLFPYQPIDECRRHVGLPLDEPIVGFSSLDSHFDLAMVMESMAIVVRKYPSVRLLITGSASPSVMKMAEAHGVAENVFLTGFLPFEELPWYLGCSNLFVLPFPDRIYNIGRWPNKICDYMCLGRPTVSNPIGDIKNLFQTHEIGLLAEWDAADFAEKICYLLENPSVAAEYGKTARHLAITQFDWKILIDKLETFYYQVLDRTRCTEHRSKHAR